MSSDFQIEAGCGSARAGRLRTAHGKVETPVFMPVGTLATVKGVPQHLLEELGVEILLGNTYHLFLRPGAETIRQMGGLHRFMAGSAPADRLRRLSGVQPERLRKVTEEGVEFRSHLDGALHFLSPESAIEVQIALGADIIMAFDECTEFPAEREQARQSMELTLRWARRCKRYFRSTCRRCRGRTIRRFKFHVSSGEDELGKRRNEIARPPSVVRHRAGRIFADLRRESAERLVEMDFPGYAIGGLSVGEPRTLTLEMAEATLPHLPAGPAALRDGRGHPDEIVQYAALGHRHDGLRAAHAGGAPRAAIYLGGQAGNQGRALRRGRRAAGPTLRLPRVRPLLTGILAASLRRERSAGGGAEYRP